MDNRHNNKLKYNITIITGDLNAHIRIDTEKTNIDTGKHYSIMTKRTEMVRCCRIFVTTSYSLLHLLSSNIIQGDVDMSII
jgi:hypothetical protein